MNPDIFESDDVAKSCPVSYRTINQYGGTTCKFAATIARSMAHALKTFYCRGALGTRVNPDTIGCVWTGEFDLNTLRVDGKFLNPGRKSCGFKNIRIRVDRALEYRKLPKVHVMAIITFGISSLWGSKVPGGRYFRGALFTK